MGVFGYLGCSWVFFGCPAGVTSHHERCPRGLSDGPAELTQSHCTPLHVPLGPRFLSLSLPLQKSPWSIQRCHSGPPTLGSAPWTCRWWTITRTPLTSSPSPRWTSPASQHHTMKTYRSPGWTRWLPIINMTWSCRSTKVRCFCSLFISLTLDGGAAP